MVGFIRFEMILPKISTKSKFFKGDCAFSIIDIRLFFECTGSVASRNRFVISIIDSIENNGNVSICTLPLDGIYKNEDELNPALSNKSNKLRLGIKET
jgi:hypothetical protein